MYFCLLLKLSRFVSCIIHRSTIIPRILFAFIMFALFFHTRPPRIYLPRRSYHRFVHFDWKTGNNNRHTHTHTQYVSSRNEEEFHSNGTLSKLLANLFSSYFLFSFFSLRSICPSSCILERLRLSTFQANSSRFITRTSDTSYLTRARSRNSHYLFVARAHSSGVK